MDLFLSHSSKDRTASETVARVLGDEWGHNVFLDTDPISGIEPGAEWREVLFRELRLCQAIVFLNSEAAQGSHWCHTELVFAIERDKPVLAIDLDAGVAPYKLIDSLQSWPGADREAAARRVAEAIGDRFGANVRPRYNRDREPYPGLRSFEADDEAVFFGRDDEISRVLARVDPTLPDVEGRLVAVVGASGAGKSSLLKAGVLPRLIRGNDWTVVGPFEPTNFPYERFTEALGRHGVDAATLAADGLYRVAERVRAGCVTRLVLVAMTLFTVLLPPWVRRGMR